MQKRLTAVCIIVVLCTLITPCTAAAESETNAVQQKIFHKEFSSYIRIQYDSTVLNSEISLENTVNIPITIIYQTNIPSYFLRFSPGQIRNYILYGSAVAPLQEIHLEILNKPWWADIQLTTDTLLMDIPYDGVEATGQTTLLITPSVDAPAQAYTFQIKASCEDVGILLGDESIYSITFTPEWVPHTSFNMDDTTITAPAGSLVNAKIEVTNEGNADVLVIGVIPEEYPRWGICLTPSYLMLHPDETKHITLHVGIPQNCTNNCYQTIQIDFTTINIYRGNRTIEPQSLYVDITGIQP